MRFPLSIVLFAQFNFSLAFLSKASSIAIVKCGSIVKSPPLSSSSTRHATQKDNTDGANNTAATTASNNNPRRRGLLRRITGDGTPYTFPLRPLTFQKQWPVEMPLQPDDFSRLDPSNDGFFYSLPRLVYHIDEPAVVALTQFYRQGIPANSDILDICSSWVSHYPVEFPSIMGRICATGMNYLELALNDQLTPGDFQVLDLRQGIL